MVTASAGACVIIRGRMKFAEDIRAAVRIGLASVRANLVPMVALWLVAGLLVGAYYSFAGIAAAFEPIAEWHRQRDLVAVSVNRLVFCGLLPGVFLVLKHKGSWTRVLRTVFAQSVFAVGCGILCNWMYSWNAWLLGEGMDLVTVTVKTIVCQFIWTPLVFVPIGSVVYFWVGCDLSLVRLRKEWPDDFLCECYLPNLLTNWIIWIPVAMAIHMFPTALQIQLSGLASAFLSLAFITLGRMIGRGR